MAPPIRITAACRLVVREYKASHDGYLGIPKALCDDLVAMQHIVDRQETDYVCVAKVGKMLTAAGELPDDGSKRAEVMLVVENCAQRVGAWLSLIKTESDAVSDRTNPFTTLWKPFITRPCPCMQPLLQEPEKGLDSSEGIDASFNSFAVLSPLFFNF